MEVSKADAVALCSGINPCAPPSASTGTLHRRPRRIWANQTVPGDWRGTNRRNSNTSRSRGAGEWSEAERRPRAQGNEPPPQPAPAGRRPWKRKPSAAPRGPAARRQPPSPWLVWSLDGALKPSSLALLGLSLLADWRWVQVMWTGSKGVAVDYSVYVFSHLWRMKRIEKCFEFQLNSSKHFINRIWFNSSFSHHLYFRSHIVRLNPS
jgi:hypothetical protein